MVVAECKLNASYILCARKLFNSHYPSDLSAAIVQEGRIAMESIEWIATISATNSIKLVPDPVRTGYRPPAAFVPLGGYSGPSEPYGV